MKGADSVTIDDAEEARAYAVWSAANRPSIDALAIRRSAALAHLALYEELV